MQAALVARERLLLLAALNAHVAGDIVIMDNLGPHKNEQTLALIAAAGATVRLAKRRGLSVLGPIVTDEPRSPGARTESRAQRTRPKKDGWRALALAAG